MSVGPGDLSRSLQLTGADRRADLRAVLSSIVARAVAADLPVGVQACSSSEAAAYADEDATIFTVAVDAVSLGEVMTHHLGVARGRAEPDRRPTR